MQRLRELDGEHLLYQSTQPGPTGTGAALILTPLALLDRIAALVPPPRVHRHRYYGVLAPNAPLRAALTALAPAAAPTPPASVPNPPPAGELALRRVARYAWAQLLARIYESILGEPLLRFAVACSTRIATSWLISSAVSTHPSSLPLRPLQATSLVAIPQQTLDAPATLWPQRSRRKL